MSLIVQIAAEWVGKKAFSDANKATNTLEKSVKKLGKTLGVTLSTAAVVAFGKASVKAFMEDEAAAIRLASAVKNLGLAYEQPEIDRYIQKLEASSAIADDQLRPALQALLTTTGSLAESQKILNLALDVSRGSGKDLTSVAQDLSQAYVGNTRGLRKYNLGLTQAELKTMKFSDIQAKLIKQFSGSNAAYLDTYAGQMQVLAVAAGNAQEVIGKGLVDALVLAGGKDADVQDVADAMKNLSTYTSDVIRGVGVLTGKLNKISGEKGGFSFKDLVILIPILGGYITALEKAGRESRPSTRANRNFKGGFTGTLYDVDAAKQAKLDKERAKLTKTQLDAQKKLTAEQKKQALAKKQSSLFDLDQIQLVAALQGKLSKEDRLRAELQLALLAGNTTEADKLSQRLAMSINSTGELAAYLRQLPDAKNPFLGWDEWLKGFTKNLATVTGSSIPTTTGGVSPAPVTPVTNAVAATVFNTLGSANASTRTAQEAARLYGGMGSSQPIVVQIDGKTVASALQDQNLSGVNSTVNRLLGGFQ